ncbi:MAG: metallophosphoesterase family protein [Pseudomonadota bacterium]
MRLAAISDIHGNSDALRAVLDDIALRSVDLIVNLGDCFSGPLDAAGTAEILAPLDLPTVRGNHDRQLVDRPKDQMGNWEAWIIDELPQVTLDWCRDLPMTREVGGMLLCHATPKKDDENWLDRRGPEHRLVARDLPGVERRAEGITHRMTLCGHTHAPRNARLPDGRRIVNPGSVGCPAYLDDRMDPNFVQQTGSPDARYALVQEVEGDWRVELISVPYDAEPMARRAEAKGAAKWAHALRTGWWS